MAEDKARAGAGRDGEPTLERGSSRHRERHRFFHRGNI